MLNPQIMQAKIKLAETQKAYKENKIKLKRVICELQNNLNPYFGDDIESLKADEIEQAADELLSLKALLIEQKALIHAIMQDLGGV